MSLLITVTLFLILRSSVSWVRRGKDYLDGELALNLANLFHHFEFLLLQSLDLFLQFLDGASVVFAPVDVHRYFPGLLRNFFEQTPLFLLQGLFLVGLVHFSFVLLI